MSHFISGVDLEGALVFHLTPPQIIRPKMRRFLRANAVERMFSRGGEQRIVERVCQRFSQMEEEKLKEERELFISNKCEVLKKKFRSAFNTRASGRSVENFFEEKEMSLMDRVHRFPMNLKQMAEKMPRRLELEKKYHSNINIKMVAIQEAGAISRQKEEYRSWLNGVNNCASSPNLNKMAFLFEKMGKRKVKMRTENTQREEEEGEIDFATHRDTSRLDCILKESNTFKTYTKKPRKPLAADKQKLRFSAGEEPHTHF